MVALPIQHVVDQEDPAVQILPNLVIPTDEYMHFFDMLDDDPHLLAAVIEVAAQVNIPLTTENVDEEMWRICAPIFQYLNIQKRLQAGDPAALAVEDALERFFIQSGHEDAVRRSRGKRVRRSIAPFALRFGTH